MSNIKYNMIKRKELGAYGEAVACKYLKQKGYDILCTNYRYSKFGEIDLVCRKQNSIFFVEVKTRCSDKYGNGAEAVNHKKQSTIKKISCIFMQMYNFPMDDYMARFCVVEVKCTYNGNSFDVDSINFIEDAF